MASCRWRRASPSCRSPVRSASSGSCSPARAWPGPAGGHQQPTGRDKARRNHRRAHGQPLAEPNAGLRDLLRQTLLPWMRIRSIARVSRARRRADRGRWRPSRPPDRLKQRRPATGMTALARGIQPPFQDVPGDHQRSSDDPIPGNLRIGANVDQDCPRPADAGTANPHSCASRSAFSWLTGAPPGNPGHVRAHLRPALDPGMPADRHQAAPGRPTNLRDSVPSPGAIASTIITSTICMNIRDLPASSGVVRRDLCDRVAVCGSERLHPRRRGVL